MRLLVTRPEPEASRTARRLRALGHEPMIAPMLATRFIDPPRPELDPAAILVTSLNGVRSLSRWSPPDAWLDRRVLAVGDRTAEAATEAGFRTVLSADGDGGALARLAIETLDPADGPLLYPAAVDRAGDWPDRLTEAGFDVTLVETYRMDPADRLPESVTDALRESRIDGILVYSPRTARALSALLGAIRPALPLDAIAVYCLSPNVAAGLDFGRVHAAGEPTEEALLSLLA
jgi:uroporphyrinogen-III synthase